MTHPDEAAVLDDEADTAASTESRRSHSGWILFGAMALVLAIGTMQVLSSNAEREEQARAVRDAQARME